MCFAVTPGEKRSPRTALEARPPSKSATRGDFGRQLRTLDPDEGTPGDHLNERYRRWAHGVRQRQRIDSAGDAALHGPGNEKTSVGHEVSR